MPISKLSSRGQTTIPKPIREELGLREGDRLEFSVEDDQVVIQRASEDISILYGFLESPDQRPVTVEEMSDAVKEAASESVDRTRSSRARSGEKDGKSNR